MKESTWLAMFGVVAAFAVIGVVSANSFSSPLAIGATQQAQEANPFGMMGHITMTIYDQAGNIIEYRQTDNTIVNAGENCVAEAMFNVSAAANGATGNDDCVGSGVTSDGLGFADGGYRFIQIGEGTDGSNNVGQANGTLTTPYTTGSMAIQSSTLTFDPSSGNGADSEAVVTITANFTATADDQVVNESGLFDASGAPRNMLAGQGFSNVTLNTADELTVEWEITIGSNTGITP